MKSQVERIRKSYVATEKKARKWFKGEIKLLPAPVLRYKITFDNVARRT